MDNYFKTSLIGKINNLPPFKNEALLPVFEAVANSIQAIEEKKNLSTGKITIEIIRDKQKSLKGIDVEKKTTGFEITDNGIGFDDVNYESFLTAETTHKLEKGGKGVGRFFWLKAFDYVEIESVYHNTQQNQNLCRFFKFTSNYGIKDLKTENTNKPQKTTVRLLGFKKEYQ